ncbi:MAG: cupin domain-containing protein [Xanthomarina gelatinilytica]|uniref:cupin domain-containing protein n=1 Tax=Xanthomarina gelatinilytica TaxID=1137281 RepID=UPI003A89EA6D
MHTATLTKAIEHNGPKPNIEVLFETDFTKEIRIAFKKGQQMKEHKTPYPIVVEIFEGHIEFGVQGKKHTLQKGALIALDGGVPHDLTAIENSIVRLTLSTSDKVERVQKVNNQ